MAAAILQVQSILDGVMQSPLTDRNDLLISGKLLEKIDMVFDRAFEKKGEIYAGMIAYLKNRYGFTYTILKYNERHHLTAIRLRKFV